MIIQLTRNNITLISHSIPPAQPKKSRYEEDLLVDRTQRAAWKVHVLQKVEFDMDNRKIEVLFVDGSRRSIELNTECMDKLEGCSPSRLVDLVAQYVYPQISGSDLSILASSKAIREEPEFREFENEIGDRKSIYAGLKIAQQYGGSSQETAAYWQKEVDPLIHRRERLVEDEKERRETLAAQYEQDPRGANIGEKPSPEEVELRKKLNEILMNRNDYEQDPLYPEIAQKHEVLEEMDRNCRAIEKKIKTLQRADFFLVPPSQRREIQKQIGALQTDLQMGLKQREKVRKQLFELVNQIMLA